MKTKPNKLIRAGLFAFAVALTASGCSTAPVTQGEPVEPIFPAYRVLKEDVEFATDIGDPWEGFNRTMYRFNYRFDKYVFLPVVNGYKTITPDVVETGIHKLFNNIKDITTLINSILQLSPQKTADTTGRLLVNTTVGLLGLINVAAKLEIPRHQEDFGQTLGHWGVGSGPYLVLPILGPSSVRDGVGLGVDMYVASEIRDRALDLETWQKVTWSLLDAIDTRANVPFRYYETGSAFEYAMVRWLWSTKRQLDIQK